MRQHAPTDEQSVATNSDSALQSSLQETAPSTAVETDAHPSSTRISSQNEERRSSTQRIFVSESSSEGLGAGELRVEDGMMAEAVAEEEVIEEQLDNSQADLEPVAAEKAVKVCKTQLHNKGKGREVPLPNDYPLRSQRTGPPKRAK